MRSVRELPATYKEQGSIDLKHDKKLQVIIGIFSLFAFVVSGWLFFLLAIRLSPAWPTRFTMTVQISQLLIGFVVFLFTATLVVIVHEAIHALFFWLFTGKWPIFGFKGLYAYAAAPDWYIPRGPFILIGLAPLVLISLVGILLMPFVSFTVLMILVLGLTLNAGGAMGDVYVVGLLLSKRGPLLVRDYGDGMVFYGL